MTPDTLVVDRRFKSVGRIHKHSGTHDPAVFRRIEKMLRDLADAGRIDILRAIRAGDVDMLTVLNATTRGGKSGLQELPVGDTMPKLAKAMRDWADDSKRDYSPEHIAAIETSVRYLEKGKNKQAKIADVAKLLKKLRSTLGAEHPRSFNLARAHVLAFVRATLTRAHPLYASCLAIEERKVRVAVSRVHITPDSMRGWFPHPERATMPIPNRQTRDAHDALVRQRNDGRVDAIAWDMFLTGMGQKELWAKDGWIVERDRIKVYGTKRSGRARDIPLVRAPSIPSMYRDTFERLFRDRMQAAGITPYHLRRAYAQLLESAGIPRARRQIYRGHGVKDIGDLYERHEVTEFLESDARKLREFLNLPEPTAPMALEVVK